MNIYYNSAPMFSNGGCRSMEVWWRYKNGEHSIRVDIPGVGGGGMNNWEEMQCWKGLI